MLVRFVMNLTNIIMTNYKISKNLLAAVLEVVYHKGRCEDRHAINPSYEKDAIQKAMQIIQEQQFIYED